MQMDLEWTRYGATSAERSATRGPALVPRLPMLQEDDDIEQYLTTFERMAEVYLWPKEDWAVHLIPLIRINGCPISYLHTVKFPKHPLDFSPFELLFAHQVRGPLDVLKDSWEANDKLRKQNILSYILKMRERLQRVTTMAQENLQQSQLKQKAWYDKKARARTFQPGEQVLLLLPTSDNKLLAKWKGPFQVKRKVGSVTYEIEIPSRQQPLQIFHVNMLKKWHEQASQPEPTADVETELLVRAVQEEDEVEEQYLPVHQDYCSLDLQHLNMEQRGQLLEIIPHQLFLETPGKKDLVQHHIYLKDSKPIHQHAYRVPEKLLPTMKQEIETMMKLEVIEPSSSEWNNPIVLVPKKDETLRFCLDFRKLNAVSKFDPNLMPRVDDLIEKLGSAMFLTTLDLCKGYWQIPLIPESKEITAFKTPFGHYHFRVLPFGLHGAPASFQRMIDQILQGTEEFAAAYLDDIIIYSKTWVEHLQHLTEVLESTIRPDKCAMSKTETTYLGYKLGHGVIRPQVGKIEAIKHAERPTSKKQVRSFLGLVGWYRHSIPHFSARAVALTNLTKKDKPNKMDWTAECESAFKDLKDVLCKEPVLQSPNFDQPFTVHTDASEYGLGAVLLARTIW